MQQIRGIAIMGAIVIAFLTGGLIGPTLLGSASAAPSPQIHDAPDEACAEMHEQCAGMAEAHRAQCQAMMGEMDHETMREQCQVMMEGVDQGSMHQMCQGMMGDDMMNGMGGMHNVMRGMMGH